MMRIRLISAALLLGASSPLAAAEFDVSTWLKACVAGVDDARSETFGNGAETRLRPGMCVKTARNACRFASDPVECFADHLRTVEEIRQDVLNGLPTQIEGEGRMVDLINKELRNARESGVMRDHCMANIEVFASDLLYFPDEVRPPEIACDHIAAALDFQFALSARRRLEDFRAGE